MNLSKGHNYDVLKSQAKDSIDQLAEISRKRFLTGGVGMDQVYAMKLAEAKQFLTNVAQDASQFPFLMAEAQAHGTMMETEAKKIVDRALEISQKLAQIEHIRRKAKLDIDAAPNKPSAIQAVVDGWIGLHD